MPPRAPARALARTLAGSAFAVIAVVVVVAVTARATRDLAVGVPRSPGDDAVLARRVAPDDAGHGRFSSPAMAGDDGASRSGEPELIAPTVGLEPDAGPPAVPGPPVDIEAARVAMVPVLERCLQEALRFDPSLGGPADVVVDVHPGAVVARLHNAPSPVLGACVEERGRALATLTAPLDSERLVIRVVLDGLRGRVYVQTVDVAPLDAAPTVPKGPLEGSVRAP